MPPTNNNRKPKSLTNDQLIDLTDFFSGKLSSDIAGLHCSLAHLQIQANTASHHTNPDSYGYDPLDRRFEAVRIERKVINALSLCSVDTIAILKAHYRPLPRIQIEEFIEHFLNYTCLIIHLHTRNLGTVASLRKLIHKAKANKRNEQATQAAIKQILILKSMAQNELQKAMVEYTNAYAMANKKQPLTKERNPSNI